jgi:hypothetical protein
MVRISRVMLIEAQLQFQAKSNPICNQDSERASAGTS